MRIAPSSTPTRSRYLGRLKANRFDPDSVANPFGRYGSPSLPTAFRNPFATGGPSLYGDE